MRLLQISRELLANPGIESDALVRRRHRWLGWGYLLLVALAAVAGRVGATGWSP